MTAQTGPFQSETQEKPEDLMADATSQVKANVEQLVQGFDLQGIAKKVEEFGRDNPLGLALTALTLGVAAGIFMRATKRVPMP